MFRLTYGVETAVICNFFLLLFILLNIYIISIYFIIEKIVKEKPYDGIQNWNYYIQKVYDLLPYTLKFTYLYKFPEKIKLYATQFILEEISFYYLANGIFFSQDNINYIFINRRMNYITNTEGLEYSEIDPKRLETNTLSFINFNYYYLNQKNKNSDKLLHIFLFKHCLPKFIKYSWIVLDKKLKDIIRKISQIDPSFLKFKEFYVLNKDKKKEDIKYWLERELFNLHPIKFTYKSFFYKKTFFENPNEHPDKNFIKEYFLSISRFFLYRRIFSLRYWRWYSIYKSFQDGKKQSTKTPFSKEEQAIYEEFYLASKIKKNINRYNNWDFDDIIEWHNKIDKTYQKFRQKYFISIYEDTLRYKILSKNPDLLKKLQKYPYNLVRDQNPLTDEDLLLNYSLKEIKLSWHIKSFNEYDMNLPDWEKNHFKYKPCEDNKTWKRFYNYYSTQEAFFRSHNWAEPFEFITKKTKNYLYIISVLKRLKIINLIYKKFVTIRSNFYTINLKTKKNFFKAENIFTKFQFGNPYFPSNTIKTATKFNTTKELFEKKKHKFSLIFTKMYRLNKLLPNFSSVKLLYIYLPIYNFFKSIILCSAVSAFFFQLFVFNLQISAYRQFAMWFAVGMLFFWLFSGFNFFLKRYKFGKLTTLMLRFWKRTNTYFWIGEGFVFILFFYYYLNSSQETLYWQDPAFVLQLQLPNIYAIYNNLWFLTFIIIYLFIWNLNMPNYIFSQHVFHLLFVSVGLIIMFLIESYQFYYSLNSFANPIWNYDWQTGLYELEIDDQPSRTKYQYLFALLIAKFWHFLFVFLAWLFFVFKSYEQYRAHYSLSGYNIQNLIILFWLNILVTGQFIKWIFRRFYDSSYYWFITDTNSELLKFLINEIALVFGKFFLY